jgi:formate-dependent nitrite reductase cytochrome c552 subunit
MMAAGTARQDRVWPGAGVLPGPGLVRRERPGRFWSYAVQFDRFQISGGLKTTMKKALFILFAVMFAVGIAAAQQLTGDILGPHNVNGHGCASCHAPHSGAAGNRGTNTASGETYLWGRDFYATTYTFNDGSTATITNTGAFAATDTLFHTAACLSCHDGNQTAVQGMTGLTVESVEGGSVTTYLNDGSESLKNDHPVHTTYDPTSSHNWPGTVGADGSITWTTTADVTEFQKNYGRPARLFASTTGPEGVGSYVECGTCHNPHSVNYSKGTYGGVKNTVKPTNFFVRGWYNTDNKNSNSGQQFCRSCHYSKSNEYVQNYGIATQ